MAFTAEVWRLGRRPGLDGLRALAVLLVLLAHFRVPGLDSAGAVGVTMFFTLSGFLITCLLLEERSALGRFSLRRFYVRRARRLWPAMMVCVALALVTELAVRHRVADWSLVVGTLTYTSNFTMVDGRFPTPTGLAHTWSLGIEEQFYLIWPPLLLAVSRIPKRWVLTLLGYACLAVLVLRLSLWHDGAGWAREYFGLDTHADSLLIGCALAFLLQGRRERPARQWPALVALATVLTACLLDVGFAVTAVPLVVAVGTAVVILVAVRRPGVPWLEKPLLVFVGRRSYGLYLYQGPVLFLTGHRSPWVLLFVSLPLLAAVTLLSWRYVEQPFLRPRASEKVPRIEPEPATAAAQVA